MKSKFYTSSNLVIIILSLSLCYSIFIKQRAYKANLIEGATDKLEYSKGDTISLSFACDKKVSAAYFHFFNLNGEVIDSLLVYTDTLFTQNDSSWMYGFKFGANFKVPVQGLSPGLYLFENKIPVLIKDSNSSKKVLLIYPAYNNMAQSPSGGKSFYKYNSSSRISSDTISFIRPFHLDEFTKNTINLIDSAFKNLYTVSNEAELMNINTLRKYKLIILYGELPYITKESLDGLENYINNGGNLIVLSPNFASGYMNIDFNKKQLIRYGDTLGNTFSEVVKRANKIVGGNYLNNSSFNSTSYKIDCLKFIRPKHSILKGVRLEDNCINYKYRLLSSPLMNPNFSLADNHKYYKSEIIAIGSNYLNGVYHLGAIHEFQKSKTSGKVLNFGNYEFVNSELIQKTEIRKLLYNSIKNYLE